MSPSTWRWARTIRSGYALAIDAFAHDSVAVPSRIPQSVCLTTFQPGVNPLTFAIDFANFTPHIAAVLALTPHTASEPPLARYVFAR